MVLKPGATCAVTVSAPPAAGTLGVCAAPDMIGPKSLVLVPFGAPGVGPVKYLQPTPVSVMLWPDQLRLHQKIRVGRGDVQRLDRQHIVARLQPWPAPR